MSNRGIPGPIVYCRVHLPALNAEEPRVRMLLSMISFSPDGVQERYSIVPDDIISKASSRTSAFHQVLYDCRTHLFDCSYHLTLLLLIALISLSMVNHVG